jgi:hypothetical protein
MINKIYKAAGNKRNTILGIDEAEGTYLIWLKDGYIQNGYNATSFVVSEDDSFASIAHYFKIIRPV